MRTLAFVMVLLAAIGAAGRSAAQVPPDVLFPGSAFAQVARGTNVWCDIEPGSATFKRNGAGPAKITLPGITWVNYANTPAVSYRLVGLVILNFANSSSGTTAFIDVTGAPTSLTRAAFVSYVQTYNSSSRALTVTFNIRLPLCTLPLRVAFRN
jgi:hypothetical protein